MNLTFLFFLGTIVPRTSGCLLLSDDTLQTVAVLPFRLPLVVTTTHAIPSALFQQEILEGIHYQKVLHERLRMRKKGQIYRLQSIAETNRILSEHGITAQNVAFFSAQELGKLLGVKAVLTTRLQAVAIRTAALGSKHSYDNGNGPKLYVVREKYRCRVSVVECRSNRVVSTYQDSFRLSNLSSPNWSAFRMMQRTVKRLAMR